MTFCFQLFCGNDVRLKSSLSYLHGIIVHSGFLKGRIGKHQSQLHDRLGNVCLNRCLANHLKQKTLFNKYLLDWREKKKGKLMKRSFLDEFTENDVLSNPRYCRVRAISQQITPRISQSKQAKVIYYYSPRSLISSSGNLSCKSRRISAHGAAIL